MPTVITHAFVGVAAVKLASPTLGSRRLWLLAVLCSIIPDADVVGFSMGIEYADFLGHRGFFHSPFFSLLLSAFLTLVFFRKQTPSFSGSLKVFLFLFIVGASHGLLDAMTDGGLGIALLAPFDDTRYFLPWRPIDVAPIGFKYMFGDWGIRVMQSEILYIWLPGIASVSVMSLIRYLRRGRARPGDV